MDKVIRKYKIYSYLEETYKNALDGGEFGIWKWNLDDNLIFLSNIWIEIMGDKVKEIKSFYDFIDKFVIMEDRKSVENDLNFYFKGNSLTYRSEFRVNDMEGNYRWILLKGKIMKDNNGKKIISGTMNDVSLKKMLEDEVKKLAYFDSLTELPNRNLFKCDFASILEQCKIQNKNGAIIFIDIDNFKQVNDTLGHDYGDLLLKVFSQILTICVENYGKVYHLSGDEFIILVNNFSSHDEIIDLCNNLMESCKDSFEIKDEKINISVSIGIAVFPEDSMDMNELYKFVDLSMYYSKNNGKNRYTFFNKKIHDVYTKQILIEQELKNALENNELYIMYQPQVDMGNNKIIGFEALLRWNNKKLGNISPAEFIPIAEKNGTIIKIGEWVLKQVCERISNLNKRGYKFGTIALNVSPIQLKKFNFIDLILKYCKENKVEPRFLEIEITEGTLIDLHNDNLKILDLIVQNGFKIAIDDFGTVYSSLNYLTMIPISTLKIDKSFIDNINKEKNQAVIKCILDLSSTLNYDVIAEGVEYKEQMDTLIDIGCSRIQGYYFSKPIYDYEIEKILKQNS